MRLTCINSGSSGNCYILQNDTEALVIECGMPWQICAEALGFNVQKVVGCLISHDHGDHAKFADKYSQYIPLYASQGTLAKINAVETAKNAVYAKQTLQLGDYTILPFDTQHDAEQPLGFLIKHPDFGTLLFATDTYYLKYRFRSLNYIMLECNYDRQRLNDNYRQGIIPRSVRERVVRSHMSVDNCIRTLQQSDLTNVNMIILLHLSANNGNRSQFLHRVRHATGKPTIFAEKGLELELL